MQRRSAGTSSLSGQHILSLCRGEPALSRALADLMNLYGQGRVPQKILELVPIRGIAMAKKPKGVRPIGVPYIFDGLFTRATL